MLSLLTRSERRWLFWLYAATCIGLLLVLGVFCLA